jgi:Uncharacterized conserved protein
MSDHDAYLAVLPEAQRAALGFVRSTVGALAPSSVECLSYGVPAFREGPGKGKVLLGYGAGQDHLALYFFDGATVAALGSMLEGFATAKGTIRFTPERPPSGALLQQIVDLRRRTLGLA